MSDEDYIEDAKKKSAYPTEKDSVEYSDFLLSLVRKKERDIEELATTIDKVNTFFLKEKRKRYCAEKREEAYLMLEIADEMMKEGLDTNKAKKLKKTAKKQIKLYS